MIAKSLKIGIVLAVMAAFFGGTAMADGRNREDRQNHRTNGYQKEYRHKHVQQYRNHHARPYHGKHHYDAHKGHGHRKHWTKHHYRYKRHHRYEHNKSRADRRHPFAPGKMF